MPAAAARTAKPQKAREKVAGRRSVKAIMAASLYHKRAVGDGEFNWRIIDGSYRAQAALSQYGGPVAAENAALNQVFAEAAKDAAKALQDQDVQGKLGWTQP